MSADRYDVVIVGSGIAGALIAKQLGTAKKKVLIIEAGAGIPPNFNDYMDRFYMATAKVPESPYTPDLFDAKGLIDPGTLNAGRPTVLSVDADNWKNEKKSYLIQKGPLAFASTYDRIAGGTANHWLGSCFRFLPNDFRMASTYKSISKEWPPGLVDWPIRYEDVSPWYSAAEHEIGVSADVKDQMYHGITFQQDYSYPMPAIPSSVVDQVLGGALKKMTMDDDEQPLSVINTPAARNSQPFRHRRACAGNSNCIPICPIQAKYDPTITLQEALGTGNVDILFRTVASELVINNGRVDSLKYIQYEKDQGGPTRRGEITAKVFVIAANAIETPRLLLMSQNGQTANSSCLVGQNLMDHPYYVAWALLPASANQIWPYRGPLITSGIESTRDGKFRSDRAAFRIDIGNEGWVFPGGDPYNTAIDFINGLNKSGPNKQGPNREPEALFGRALALRLNAVLTRQFRLGFLVEQTPDTSNAVTLANEKDGLGLPRPAVKYDLSDYTKRGIAAAKLTAESIFRQLQAEEFTTVDAKHPCTVEWPRDSKQLIQFYGAGHIVGTCRMGTTAKNSVVNADLRSWDHPNLFLAGSSVFPTVATGNPTLTIAALSLRLANTILKKDLT